MEERTGSKGVCPSCILSSCLFNLYAEYIMRNSGLEEAQTRMEIAGKISATSDMQMTPSLWQKQRVTKGMLDETETGE